MATPSQHSTTSAAPSRTVPVGQKDTRSMNTVLLYGVAAFAIFAVLFVLFDLVNGNL